MNTKKIIAGIMAVSMLGAFAVPVYAADKEEVIYVMADPDGSVNNVYVVNSFDGGNITDYGSYSSVKLMNIDGSISNNEDKITFSSPEGQKVYYQGDLNETEIPWDISIKYYIDGKELSAAEAAGKSGSLEIKIKITENTKCDPVFYENYALQCSFTLDTEKCSNIAAEGATLANVGRKKQITFTALAGCGLEKSITADVKDFEMSAAQINGIKMNLGLDIDFDGNISDLTDGAKKLDDGANELYSGCTELDGGVSDLNSGIEKLRNGIDTAEEGLAELNSRSSELTGGSAKVKAALLKIQSSLSAVSANADDAEKLTAASAEIKTGIDNLCSEISELKKNVSYSGYKSALAANGADIDTLRSANAETIEQLTAQLTELKSQLAAVSNDPQYKKEAAELTAQAEQLENILKLLTANNAVIGGTETYMNNVSDAAAKLEAGANELKTSYAEFDAAIGKLAQSIGEMLVNMSSLSDGINTLTAEYINLDNGITEYTDGVKKLYDGYADIADGAKELAEGGITLSEGTKELVNGSRELADGTGELCDKTSVLDAADTEKLSDVLDSMNSDSRTVSFVSEKNTEVSSVQFVISTEEISIPEPEKAAEEPEEKLNFFQKLLRLFRLY